ncbi:MAG: efflux RND transporter periplasmic adaptor subunit, partial [Alcanivorax sp.]|nr:efflux RND transporter periplasmic adaptor subunit [Alcanivorax sp.]
TIRQLDPISVDLTQSSSELQALRRELASGQLQQADDGNTPVTLLLEDGSRYPQTGTLQFSEFAVEASTGSVTLRALFPNPNDELLPGMFVRARLPEGERNQAILVPQKAISRDPTGRATALVIGADNTVKQVNVSTSRAVGNRWLIRSGLQAGDRLIVDGLQKIRPGITVTPVAVDSSPAATESVAADPHADQ